MLNKIFAVEDWEKSAYKKQHAGGGHGLDRSGGASLKQFAHHRERPRHHLVPRILRFPAHLAHPPHLHEGKEKWRKKQQTKNSYIHPRNRTWGEGLEGRCSYGLEEVGVGGGFSGRSRVPWGSGERAEVEIVAAGATAELRRSHGRRSRVTPPFSFSFFLSFFLFI